MAGSSGEAGQSGEIASVGSGLDIYQVLFANGEVDFLREVRKDSLKLLGVGDIASRAYARAAEKGIPAFVAFHVVGLESGHSARRIGVLRQVSERFPEAVRLRYAALPFAVFEEAYAFPPGDDLDMLEYALECYESQRQLPAADRIAFLYRRDILGVDIGPLPAQPPALLPGTLRRDQVPVQINELIATRQLLESLRQLADRWRSRRPETVEECLIQLEKLLG